MTVPPSITGFAPSGTRPCFARSPTVSFVVRKTSMKTGFLVCGVLALSMPVIVDAQSPDSDVRCMLISSGFSRLAKNEDSRRASAMTAAFYLGRISERIKGPSLSASIRAQGNGVPAKEAEPIMRACAARASTVQDQMTAVVKQTQSGK